MRTRWKSVVGVVVSVLLLAWVLRDISLSEVIEEIRGADPLPYLGAVTVATLGFLIRALRWKILLAPIAPDTPLRPRYAATTIGFAVNNLLPARIGEFARAFSLSRLTSVPASAALGSLVVERIFDALVLVGFLFAAMASPGFPTRGLGALNPGGAAVWLLLVVGIGSVALFLLAMRPDSTMRIAEKVFGWVLPQRFRAPVGGAMRAFVGGLAVLRSPRLFFLSLAWAVGQWAFLALSDLLAFRAFGIDEVGYVGALFLQSVIGLAVAVPSSPGFFGPYEAAARIGLSLWGVPAEKAVSFAIGLHLGSFIPVTAIGLYYVWRLDLRWGELLKGGRRLEEKLPAPPPVGTEA